MRLCIVCFVFLAAAFALTASDIGVTVNGMCEAGSCPAVGIPFGSTDTLSVDSIFTLPDGDMYLIDGSFTGSNNGNGSGFSTGHQFQVTYEGNATGGPSAADDVAVEAYY